MKTLIIACLCAISTALFAQAPEAFNFQGVLRGASGTILPNQNAQFKISILQGSATGTAVYAETDVITTNSGGAFNIEVGHGVVASGTFGLIDWANGSYFLQVEVDTAAGTNYIMLSSTQILSSPYALYAKSAGSVSTKPCIDTVAIASLGTLQDTLDERFDTTYGPFNIDTIGARLVRLQLSPAVFANLSSSFFSLKVFRNGDIVKWGGGFGINNNGIIGASAPFPYSSTQLGTFNFGDLVRFEFFIEVQGCKKVFIYSFTL